MRFNDAIINKETGGKTYNDNSQDFFSKNTINVNLILVRFINEEVDNLDGNTIINNLIIILFINNVKVFPKEIEL